MPSSPTRFFPHAFFRTWDVLTRPQAFLAELAESGDTRPAWAALIVTSLLFATSAVVAHVHRIPMTDAPVWDIPNYRLFEAACMPVFLWVGGGLCCLAVQGLGRLFQKTFTFFRLWALLIPALLVPLWPTLWPTDLAVSLGILNNAQPGFPGLWVRELMPACTFLYMLLLLTMGIWQWPKTLLREAFALAVTGLVPPLLFWAWLLR